MPKINNKNLIKRASNYLHKECPDDYENATGKKLPNGSKLDFPFPLDKDVINELNSLRAEDKEIPYLKADDLNKLWIKLIEKSIQCLRFFDARGTVSI